MPEFLLGLILGMVLGGVIGVFVLALCVAAARGDEP
jgi:hypothetical protein